MAPNRRITIFLFAALLFAGPTSAAADSLRISINASDEILADPVSGQAIRDVLQLLEDACACTVGLNDHSASMRISLPASAEPYRTEAHRFDASRGYPVFHYPEHGYRWNARRQGSHAIFELTASTTIGIANALYGLLQEKLGFAFYHPRAMIIPGPDKVRHWRPGHPWTWTARPRFTKKGFHLHTQHPLELTEQLMQLDDDSWEDVREYIDWLARNQQNYFEFNLLESIHRATWPALAKRMVDYLHSRGMIAGLDLSLHMIQQKSFMLYESPPNVMRSKEKQILQNVELLFKADWDVWNVEFSTTEFTGGNVEQKKRLQAYLNELLIERGCKLMGRAHVVRKEELIGSGGAGSGETLYGAVSKEGESETADLDSHRGIMSHTVMFYTAFEENAPVYGNENLRHMLDLLEREQRVRETWYYPESAYWITFDNSVPMLLLPYLHARLDDILQMHELGVEGHLTFSSGWEWGYWLVDWSIARWSWEHTFDGEVHAAQPTEFISDVVAQTSFHEFLGTAADLHREFLKDNDMIRYMTAQTVTDEMPGSLNLQLHPRPQWSYPFLQNESGPEQWAYIDSTVLPALLQFHDRYFSIRDQLDMEITGPVVPEIMDALDVVAWRALHRFYTLKALIADRKTEEGLHVEQGMDELLDLAGTVRERAQEKVSRREAQYRYDVEQIARRRWGHTAYHFGYLYPVHDLHFWNREEMQVRKNNWSPLFMNIWNITRIIGLTD